MKGELTNKILLEKITVVFDGQVSHPDQALELTSNQGYTITIETETPTKEAWDVLEEFAESVIFIRIHGVSG